MKKLLMRPGTTLIELLIFVALIGLVIGIMLPILFASTENRLLQLTIGTVEQNGIQTMQTIALRVRQGERILDPAAGHTGSVLALQTSSGSTNPTILGILSGSLVVIRYSTKEVVSATDVAIRDFVVKNTSTSASRQSVQITFKVSRTIRLQQPHSYTRTFEGVFNLLPDDIAVGDACNCATPQCPTSGTYQWEVCESNSCYSGSTPLQCP